MQPPQMCCLWIWQACHWPTKSTPQKPVPEWDNALKGYTLLPGQHNLLDHFVCSTKGFQTFSKHKAPLDNMYCGRAIFVYQVSRYISIHSQVTFSSVESLQVNLTFEQMCFSNGMSVISYMCNNGTAEVQRFCLWHHQLWVGCTVKHCICTWSEWYCQKCKYDHLKYDL